MNRPNSSFHVKALDSYESPATSQQIIIILSSIQSYILASAGQDTSANLFSAALARPRTAAKMKDNDDELALTRQRRASKGTSSTF